MYWLIYFVVIPVMMMDLSESCFYATHYSLRLYRLFDICHAKGFYGFMIRCIDVIYHSNTSWHCMMIWTWINRYTTCPFTPQGKFWHHHEVTWLRKMNFWSKTALKSGIRRFRIEKTRNKSRDFHTRYDPIASPSHVTWKNLI